MENNNYIFDVDELIENLNDFNNNLRIGNKKLKGLKDLRNIMMKCKYYTDTLLKNKYHPEKTGGFCMVESKKVIFAGLPFEYNKYFKYITEDQVKQKIMKNLCKKINAKFWNFFNKYNWTIGDLPDEDNIWNYQN